MKILGPDGVIEVDLPYTADLSADGTLTLPDGEEWVEVAWSNGAVWVWWNGYSARFTLPDALEAATEKEARAPMTGKVVSLPVKTGDEVKLGDTLAILEAMKMEYRLEAEADGVVEELGAAEGDLVDLGQMLVRLK